MKRLLAASLLAMATAVPAPAEQIISGVGWGEGSFSVAEHVSIAFERDFSGTYGWGTYVYGDSVFALAFDCVTFEEGAGLGEGVLVASGVVVGGVPLPLFDGITVKVNAQPGVATVGVVYGLHVQTGDCGASKVTMQPGLTASVGYAPLPV